MTDDLEPRLLALAAEIDYPPTPDLARAVRLRLTQARRRPFLTRWRLALAALAAALVVVLGVPGIRTAVAHWLGIGGVVITPVQTLPPAPIHPPAPSGSTLGSGLSLGRPSSLAAARMVAGFPVVVPGSAGEPDAVYVRADLGTTVTLVYAPRPGLPATQETGVGLLVTEFRGDADPALIQKVVGPDTTVTSVTVAGGQGFWLAGAPHEVIYHLPAGCCRSDPVRLAGPTLVFQRGDISVRIEGASTEAQALAIAGSLG